MKYISTRGNNQKITSAEAIIKGLADDGGLFVPEEMPKVDMDFIEGLRNLSYQERAVMVLKQFLTDYTQEDLEGCVERAYGNGKFDNKDIAPVKALKDVSVLELWHGPTSAFKDMALQLLPQLLSTALGKTGEKNEVVILVATSGDTGKAALEGFRDVPQTKIMVFYPDNGVSRIQRLQMVTQKGGNVSVIAVKGNFDDAQSGVKAIFSNQGIKAQLMEKGVSLSSANSINWGRLVPQIVYYFSAYADLLNKDRIKAGDKISFVVPTGNFGDILAGYYAMAMGLPVNKLVCASNSNNVLTDFLTTGIYDRNRAFYKTISPSMDILISSNLERLLYHITGDANKVAGWMQQLAEEGCYNVGPEVLDKIKAVFAADWSDDEATGKQIADEYSKEKYVADPHTAVAWRAAEKASGIGETVVVSTASPYKFNESVLNALGHDINGKDEFTLLDELARVNTDGIPAGLAGLKGADILHSRVVDKNEMKNVVFDFSINTKQ
ncbi:MAG: threonine synthase [Anaerovibrio sp.]|uniref:threonine synthase n=1 Tax=Anaerovibrio sp. TaxID=1872532 RepID=UPI0025D382CC|nr:threonine synthase [Anaerovibrio sp.]MCR5175952.1 threonine synthase [Anaerovibrio sp.]